MSEEQVTRGPSELRKYRTELPNLYDDADLTPYEFRLLAHYKRVGCCFEGLGTTAVKCRMSEGQVSQCRRSLARKGFIVMKRDEMDKGRFRFVVRVVDQWKENFERYSDRETSPDQAHLRTPVSPSPHEAGPSLHEPGPSLHEASPSPHEGSPSLHEGSPSPHEGKNEPIKKEQVVVVGAGGLFSTFEQEIGSITPHIADWLRDVEAAYPPGWVEEAIQVAAANNCRRWQYVNGVLKNCRAKGVRPLLSRVEKTAYDRRSVQKRAAPIQRYEYTDIDREVANAINALQQMR